MASDFSQVTQKTNEAQVLTFPLTHELVLTGARHLKTKIKQKEGLSLEEKDHYARSQYYGSFAKVQF